MRLARIGAGALKPLFGIAEGANRPVGIDARVKWIVVRITPALVAVILAVAPTVIGAPSKLTGEQPFWQPAFDAAKEAEQPIVVHFTFLVPMCAVQIPALEKLRAMPKYKNFVMFNIDSDARKDLAGAFEVRLPSAITVFKGKTEIDRVIGETRHELIAGRLDKAN